MEHPAFPGVRVHPTAILEDGVRIGAGSSVWDGVHVRRGARLGRKCIVGEKTYIAYDVVVGDLVKINAAVYVCAGTVIEDGVMIAAHVVFTNDRFPRAANADLTDLLTSDPTEETQGCVVRRGATVGANATIGPGIELGAYCMIGMGSVVTRSVGPHVLAFGSPARPQGYVCACGHPLGGRELLGREGTAACAGCHNTYRYSPAGCEPCRG